MAPKPNSLPTPVLRPRNTKGPLAQPAFATLFYGQMASALGDQAFVVSLAAIAVGRGDGLSVIGAALAGRAAAIVLFSMLGGLLADRLDRVSIMFWADGFRMAVAFATVPFAASGSPLALAGFSVALGAGEAVFRPAYAALLPSVVHPDVLASANAWTAAGARLATLLGPAFAGAVVVSLGLHAALLVNALSFVVSLACIARARTMLRAAASLAPTAHERADATWRTDLSAGFAATWSMPWVVLILGATALNLLMVLAPWYVLLPALSAKDYGGAQMYGFLLSCMGVGAMLGAVGAARYRGRRPGVPALTGLALFAPALLSLRFTLPLPITALAAAVAAAGQECFEVLWITALQRRVAPELVGRVMAIDYSVSLALFPVGLALVSPVTSALGTGPVLVIAAALSVATTLPLLASRQVRALAGHRTQRPMPRATSTGRTS